MRNVKRFLALILTVLMVAGCVVLPVSAEKASNTFDDVDEYTDAINTLYALGVIKGTTETTYGTAENVKRYQAALFFARVLTGKVNDETWKTGINNTMFQDLGENPFINAISYANDNGIVLGKSATAFDPEGGIKFQEGLAMAVRALGYDTPAMQKGYPWSYIDKAISLGLDKNLESINDYTKVLNRGETAQLIYNMLFAETKGGYTYATKSFDLITETFVLTATNTAKYMITATTTYNPAIAAPGYIGMSALAADGTLGKTYYFKADDFKTIAGIDKDADLNDYIGRSFDLIADSTLATVYEISANGFKKYVNDTDKTEVDIKNNDNGNKIVIEGENYTAVTKYTTKLWNKDVKNTAANESLVYNWSEGQTSTTGGYYYYDQNGNITTKEGQIALYLRANTNIVNNNGMYVYMVKTGDNTYRVATEADFAAVTYYTQGNASNYWKVVSNANEIASNNYYSEMVCFDDDNDGKYDRMLYTQYKFGQFVVDGDNRYVVDANGTRVVTTNKNVAIKGETVENGTWMAYAYNGNLNEMLVKKTYTFTKGYVNGFNTTGSIVIDGTSYGIGNIALSGIITTANLLSNGIGGGLFVNDIIGKYVEYIKIGNTVVAFSNNGLDQYVVYGGVVNATSENDMVIKVYTPGSASAKLIHVASLNGLPLSQYVMIANKLQYNFNKITNMAVGTLLSASVDKNGIYHVYETQANIAAGVATNKLNTTLELRNSAVNFNNQYNHVAYVGNVPTFQADANTLFVFVDVNGISGVYTGTPVTGSAFSVGQDGYFDYYYKNGTTMYASLVYVYNAEEKTGSFKDSAFDYIVYTNATTTLGTAFSDQFNGTVWTYTNAVNVSTGAYTTVYSASRQLQKNMFYMVKDGYVFGEPIMPGENSYVRPVTIESMNVLFGGVSDVTAIINHAQVNLSNVKSIIGMTDGAVKLDNGNIVNYYNAETGNLIQGVKEYFNAYVVAYDLAEQTVKSLVIDPTVQYHGVDTTVEGAKATFKFANAYPEGYGIEVSVVSVDTTITNFTVAATKSSIGGDNNDTGASTNLSAAPAHTTTYNTLSTHAGVTVSYTVASPAGTATAKNYTIIVNAVDGFGAKTELARATVTAPAR